jgi:hypothetical protein
MYIWQADPERLADLAKRFQSDTARANLFKACRVQSSLLCFTGADAIGYFQRQFGQDFRQAMTLGGALMSVGVFLALDEGQDFVNDDRVYVVWTETGGCSANFLSLTSKPQSNLS